MSVCVTSITFLLCSLLYSSLIEKVWSLGDVLMNTNSSSTSLEFMTSSSRRYVGSHCADILTTP